MGRIAKGRKQRPQRGERWVELVRRVSNGPSFVETAALVGLDLVIDVVDVVGVSCKQRWIEWNRSKVVPKSIVPILSAWVVSDWVLEAALIME